MHVITLKDETKIKDLAPVHNTESQQLEGAGSDAASLDKASGPNDESDATSASSKSSPKKLPDLLSTRKKILQKALAPHRPKTRSVQQFQFFHHINAA